MSHSLMNDTLSFAQTAGALSLRWFQTTDLNVEEKDDGSPVTIADRTVETELRRLITETYPNDTIIGEEFGETGNHSGRVWYVDPIDGTKAFTQGVPLFSTLVAVWENDEPLAAAIYLPALDETVVAGKDLGCFWNGQPCHVSIQATLAKSYITSSGLEYLPIHLLQELHTTGAHIRTWGDGYGFALVATGRADIMVDYGVSPWDIEPMSLILTEAGGTFSAFDGSSSIHTGTAIGSNGLLHQSFLALLPKDL